ncbi:MAG: RsmE family RNA methyltransferase [Rickettsia sp.]|nr:RsmE family RNA methyltransferase [Rickettsia sp.]
MLKYKNLIRKYIDSSLRINEEFVIKNKIFHHLVNVLRVREKALIRVFDNKKEEFLAQISSIKKNILRLTILKPLRKDSSNNKIKVSLGLSIIDKKIFMRALDYAVQLDIDELYPIISSRSQNKYISYNSLEERMLNSTEQSERVSLTKIHPIRKLKELLLDIKQEIIFLNEREENLISDKLTQLSKDSFLLVGPEGGFTEEEEIFVKNITNVTSVSLGKNILTTELSVASALSYINLLKIKQEHSQLTF